MFLHRHVEMKLGMKRQLRDELHVSVAVLVFYPCEQFYLHGKIDVILDSLTITNRQRYGLFSLLKAAINSSGDLILLSDH